MKVLVESKNYILAYEFEEAFLIKKSSNEKIPMGNHYGDPSCGLICNEESLFIVGGEGLTVLDKDGKSFLFLREPALNIHSIKIDKDGNVKVLIDPWSDESAIWLLDVQTLSLEKVRDFDEYKNQPYQDEVEF